MDELTDPAGIAALAACALALIALIVATVAAMRLRKVRAAQQTVLGGEKTDLVARFSTVAAFTPVPKRGAVWRGCPPPTFFALFLKW